MKSKGPSTDPWGMPDNTGKEEEDVSSTTNWSLLLKYIVLDPSNDERVEVDV